MTNLNILDRKWGCKPRNFLINYERFLSFEVTFIDLKSTEYKLEKHL